MAKLAIDIRSVLIPITGQQLLLPNATVAEVIGYTKPDPFSEAPSWVLGRVTWRGWRVPVVSLAMLGRWAGQEHTASARIAVLKGLGGNADMPFMAIVTQGFPHLVTVSAENLEGVEEDETVVPQAAVERPFPEPAGPGPGNVQDEDGLDEFSVEMEFADLEAQGENQEFGASETADDPFGEEESGNVGPDAPTELAGVPEDFSATAAVVRVDGQRAVIPDLLRVEKLVVQTIGREALRAGT